jgi:hypothetical protein
MDVLFMVSAPRTLHTHGWTNICSISKLLRHDLGCFGLLRTVQERDAVQREARQAADCAPPGCIVRRQRILAILARWSVIKH